MLSAEALIIISALAGAVATLAGRLYLLERGEKLQYKREVKYLTAIIIGKGAQDADLMAEYKRFLEAKELSGGE